MSASAGSHVPEPVSATSTHFAQMIADVEREAQDAGPQAVAELEQLRREFELASALIARRRSVEWSEAPRGGWDCCAPPN